MDLIHSLNHVDWTVLSPIHTHSLQRHVSQLKEATICAMAHMLTANIDSGLTHAIGILYHTLYNMALVHMYICSLGSHKMKASALTTYVRCTSNRTVNIAGAGTVYSLYTRQLVLCAT